MSKPPQARKYYRLDCTGLFGVYQEVVPCTKLVHSFHWRSDRGEEEGPSLVAIEFLERGASTDVVITHSLLPAGKKKGTQSGWVDVLDGVEDCLPANR